jgi:hypothetical protein
LEKAPQLLINETNVDLGRIKASSEIVREVSFSNSGKKDLLIKAVQGNCTCVKASASKTSIKPGETSSFKIAFDPQDRSGTQTKAVTIYTNDPKNPVQRFTLTAYVD